MATLKAIKTKAICAGKKRLCIAPLKDAFSVWEERTNYKLGKLIKSWVCCKQNVTLEEAEKYYNKRT